MVTKTPVKTRVSNTSMLRVLRVFNIQLTIKHWIVLPWKPLTAGIAILERQAKSYSIK